MTDTTKPHAGRLAEAIAAHLPGWSRGLRAEEDDRQEEDRGGQFARLVLGDGPPDSPGLFLSVQVYPPQPGRLHVACSWPTIPGPTRRDYQPHDMTPFRIGLDGKRPPAILAREITRRLLVRYLPEWQQQHGRKLDDLARAGEAEALAHELARIIGDPAPVRRYYPHDFWRVARWLEPGVISFEFDVQPTGVVEVRVRPTTPEQARNLAHHLAELLPEDVSDDARDVSGTPGAMPSDVQEGGQP